MTHNLNIFYPPFKKEIKINQFDVKVVELNLFKNAKLAVCLHDEDNNPVDWRYYQLDNDDYSNWNGSDDSYIVNYVKRKLREETEIKIAGDVVNVFKTKLKQKSNNQSNNDLAMDTKLYS